MTERSHGRLSRRLPLVALGPCVLLAGGVLYAMARVHHLGALREEAQVLFLAPARALPPAEAALHRAALDLYDLESLSRGDRGDAALLVRARREELARAVAGVVEPRAEEGAAPLWRAVAERGGERVLQARGAAAEEIMAGHARFDSLLAAAAAGQSVSPTIVRRSAASFSLALAEFGDANGAAAELAERDISAQLRYLVRAVVSFALLVLVGAGAAMLWTARAFRRRVLEILTLARELEPRAEPPRARRTEVGLDQVAAELTAVAAALQARREREAASKEALATRLVEAERVSAYKTWFIGHVSHEFRTPLSAIIGFTSLLRAEGERLEPPRRAEYLEIALRNARHLLHVINDILNLSKVEAGTLEVTLAEVDAADVIAAAVEALRPMAAERGIELRYARTPGALVVADSGRLKQVLLNLVENAIKYSPAGARVEIEVVRSEINALRIEVQDLGPGIAREHQAKLFREFSRIAVPGTRISGAGLGLSLARRLVELMGGEIGVDSVPGQGSTFWVRLRAGGLGGACSEQIQLAGERRPRHERVVVVDDEPDIATYVVAVLTNAGYVVSADGGGAGVVERVQAFDPDLVLLDLDLGEKRGADVLRALRARAPSPRPLMVAFTASAITDDQEWARAYGFDHHISKPIEPATLVAAVDELFASRDAPRAAAPEVREPEADFLEPLRQTFRGGLPTRLQAIEQCLRTGDAEALRREVHKLRGAAGGYGFSELAAAAAAAEECLASGAALSSAELGAALGALHAAAETVLEGVEAA